MIFVSRRAMYISRNTFKSSLPAAVWLLGSRSLHCSTVKRSMEWYPCPNEYKKKDEVSPLVVLLGWLLAKSRHLHKYGELYHQHGADVITLKLGAMEILRPKRAEQVAIKILNELISEKNKYRPVVVHGFSVGGYLYSHVLNMILTKEKFSPVKERIIGQVFDSPVDFQGVPYGISNATFDSPPLRRLMQSSIELYLSLTARYTTKVYHARSALFHNNPVRSSTLFLFSEDDKVADAEAIRACAQRWREAFNMQVSQKCWDSSPHVSHFYVHNKEYAEAIRNFLMDLNISPTVRMPSS